ncbi:MAG: hypothetical protein IJQ20_06645 [Paludibacteraceae bacterium]|nr:hypothetical protein [Paludibacteraceae bacterium]
MSLKLGRAFNAALESNPKLLVTLGADPDTLQGARIFSVARTDEDEQEDKMPYVVMMPNGVTSQGTKDEYDQTDSATIGLLVAAGTFDELINLADIVRKTIENNLCDDPEFTIDDWTFSADAVQFDNKKPCFFQTLTYICNTQN